MSSSKIAKIRKQKKLMQSDVAQYLNITQQTYSAYETGRSQMSYEMLCMLADFYEVSTDYLLGRTDAVPSFLSDSEREMLNKFRALDSRAKATVENCLRFEHFRTNSK
ncbi:MAG: helix-turn-helix domain-containing protein [Defluviitaleaceae bacterium]|nr:helix-turn-helix domain-containing protein [Defluviitaleaceae bacterium]MCL2263187.1 helix-turn-helix domain-containing protein [Defluviitaleaceae bacterium]